MSTTISKEDSNMSNSANNNKVQGEEENRPTDEQILKYERELKDSLFKDMPLVGDRITNFDSLAAEYVDNPNKSFTKKIKQLSSLYSFHGLRTFHEFDMSPCNLVLT
jgi:hypothetical protein